MTGHRLQDGEISCRHGQGARFASTHGTASHVRVGLDLQHTPGPSFLHDFWPGPLVAQMDALERERRLLEALELRQEKAELAALDADLKALAETTDLVARAALTAAGYRQHKRGEWRRRRERDSIARPGRSEEA
jgi:hypothetical protein